MRAASAGSRPIRSILCLLENEVVPFSFGTVNSGRTTLGHRFLSTDPLTIEHVHGYAAALHEAKVILDPEERKRQIEDRARVLARSAGFLRAPDAWLEAENVGLVEWPVVLMGAIDPASWTSPLQCYARPCAPTSGISA